MTSFPYPRPRVCFAVLAAVLVAAAPRAQADTEEAAPTPGAYALDDVSRIVAPTGRVRCPDLDMVRYRGDVIRYHKPVYVFVGFRERLRAFERVVRDVAIEIYGRAPRRIRHLGTYSCRRIRTYPTFLSEHALGNAIDVEGFDFGPARGQARRAAPPRLRRSFQVRIEQHWDASRGTAAVHSRFLRTLAQRLVEREDIFRVLLGPSYPGHKNHFHFDVSPWRMVEL